MKKSLPSVLATVALLAVALTGCTGVASVNEKPAGAAAGTTEEPAAETKPTTPTFGNEYVYDDGVAITVAVPVAFQSSAYAAGADQANQLRFTLTITNGSDAPMDPYAYPTVSSAGVEGSSIIDMDANLTLGPSTAILPGKSITWDVGYSVADPADLTFQVSPGFEYTEVLFTN